MSLYVSIPPSSGGGSAFGGAWVSDQVSFLGQAVSQLTRFERFKIGQSSMGQALSGTSDGAREGGARTAPNTTGTMFGASVFQTTKTGYWGMSILGKFATPVVARNAFLGLCNAAGSHDIIVGTIQSVSATNYCLLCDGAVSTTDVSAVVADTNYHTFAITGDTANVKVYIDGTLRITRAIGTNLVDEGNYLLLSNTVSGEAVFADCIVGYVGPTP